MQRRSLLLLGVGAVLAGCGGGGGGEVTPATRVSPRISIRWGARSRAVSVNSTPLSVVVALRPAAGGTEESFVVNRPAGTVEQTETYTAPFTLPVGDYQLTLTAYAVAGGSGSVLARGNQNIPLTTEGTLPDVVMTGTVASVHVAAGQTLGVGERRALQAQITGTSGEALAVSEGSLFWEVLSGGDRVRVEEGRLLGVAPGSAMVRVRVDGIASEPTAITCVSGVVVQVVPQTVKLSVGGSQTFTAQVLGAPAEQSGVVWALREGDVAGSISSTGSYQSGSVPGIYHVVATSIYDPTRSGEAEIQVQGGNLQVGVRWEETGGLGVGVR